LASFKNPEKDKDLEKDKHPEKDKDQELPQLGKEKIPEEKKKNSIDSELETLDRLIEVSILQQMIYQASPNDIPDSRFQRIIGLSNNKLIWFSIGSVFWLISFFILFRFGGLQKANPEDWTFVFDDLSWSTALALPVFFFGIGFFMFKLGRVLSNSKISKVNIKGEVELGRDLDKSILNKHLDEILYFFEQTEFNIVVFEDLDRFKNTHIFTKLREINLLLNKSHTILKKNKKIVFIYAVRDEMFENSERVKFFDYIIPVIPFINPSNAKDQFYNLLKIEKLESELKTEFIDDVVTFIDNIDMRLLINVFQEFSIYKKQMGSGIILENLFSLILYKNLYPKDFTELPRRRGDLFKFFKNQPEYVKILTDDIEQDIEELNNNIKNIEEEKITEFNELKALYLSVIKQKTDALEIKLGDKWLPFKDLYDDDNLIGLIEQESITFRRLTFNYTYQKYDTNRIDGSFNFSSIENGINTNHSFYDRRGFIEQKADDSVEELKEKLLESKMLKKDIESSSIQRIFEKISIESYLKDFEHYDLLGNLLKNGYIDENYMDYVTIFHEAKIKLSDKQFIKKVKSGQASDYSYFLTKPNEVIKEIPTRYFSRKEILNHHILGYLLRFGDSHNDKKDRLIRHICEARSGTKEELAMFQFIDEYINFYENPKDDSNLRTSGSIPKLIKILSFKTGLLWNTILSSNTTAKKQIDKYVKLVVLNSDPHELSKNIHNTRFKGYLKANSSVINLFKKGDGSQKLATILQILDIKFSALVPKNEDNSSIYEFIYENNYYFLTPKNIEEVLKEFDSIDSKSDLAKINKANYTQIQESNCVKLKEYVDKHINQYLEEVFFKINENEQESVKSITSLLNNKKVKEEFKERIIKKQETKVNDISKIVNQANIVDLLKYEKIVVSWSNTIKYYHGTEDIIDLFLIDYLNQQHNFEELCKNKIPDEIENIDKDIIKKFSISLIKCKGLNQESYVSILKSVPNIYTSWKNIDFGDLQEEKVSYLIDNNFLSLTQENFDLINEKFKNFKTDFLIKKKTLIKDALEDEELALENDDIDLLLDSERVSDGIKEDLIKDNDRNRIISDSKIAKLIGYISSKYNRTYLTYSELSSIFTNGGNNVNEKLIMLNNHFEGLENPQIQELLSSISKDHKDIFNSSKRPAFNVNEASIKLAENLKGKRLIKSHHYQNEGQLIRFFPLD
jgi:hypothetical protein